MTILCPACLIENFPGALTCSVCGYSLADENGDSTVFEFPMALRPQTMLKQGQYRIENPLGQGGFGIAYKAVKVATGETVAIKEFLPERSVRQGNQIIWSNAVSPQDRQEYIREFLQEGESIARCSPHPHIVKPYEWFEENNTGYIILEFVPGKTLDKILKQEKKLSESRVKKYFLKVAAALQVTHGKNLLHRDIKPDNIIINLQDEPVLIDFGNTREYIAHKTQNMSAIAAVGYAPPEQFVAYARRSPSMDFYSVCASMYELLTGQLPISALERIHKDELVPPRSLNPSISLQMESILLTGLRMKVEERFQTADELINALEGNFTTPVLKKARQLVSERNFPGAISAYQKHLQANVDDLVAMAELAAILVYFNQEQAEAVALQALQLDGNNGLCLGILGLINCRRGHWQSAFNYLKQATQISPREGWLQANLAWAAGKLGQWSLASQAIEQAMDLEKTPFILSIGAWVAFEQKQWKNTIRFARPAIFQARQEHYSPKTYSWLYPHLAIALQKSVLTAHALDVERCLEEYAQDEPNSVHGMALLAWHKAKQQQWQLALDYFQQANRSNDKLSWALLNEAILLEKINKITEAIQVYQNYLNLLPQNYFVYFRCGTLLGRKKQFSEAKEYLTSALDLNPNQPEVYHNLGWVLLSMGIEQGIIDHSHEIIQYYRQAVELYRQSNSSGNINLAQQIQQAFAKAHIRL
ncbi:serine/threonine-protein kinase [Synechocystis sp. PCC 7338]|uniref:serine/threonine-protein kinase n=1 Tax=Synechocystis sp. PCC 7338 TaxID=2732530 RepID=UPI001BB0323C|nr:serine/threonine-protein kinase [Synechocystis sp. PCC 7338]QUS60494.1 protein kinase [Synechocystis sp. PCC 7338]